MVLVRRCLWINAQVPRASALSVRGYPFHVLSPNLKHLGIIWKNENEQ